MQGRKSRMKFLVMGIDFFFFCVSSKVMDNSAYHAVSFSKRYRFNVCVCTYDMASYVFSTSIEANIELQVILGVKDKASTIDKIVIK